MRAITDLNIEAGYPYELELDLNDYEGVDLEDEYTCYFECDSIGKLELSVVVDSYTENIYSVTISKENTDKLLVNLEKYIVHTIKTSDGSYDKLLEGRIHINNKVRTWE